MKYQVLIETIDGQSFVETIDSNSDTNSICERIFNQTPNVRSVEVVCYNSKETFFL
jgi:hypothetical protein